MRRLSFSTSLSEKMILVSQLLNHFDTALYGLLAPLLAPLFFPHHSPLAQLILAYGVLAVGLIARPLGNYFFGLIAYYFSPEWGLRLSLPGITLSMVLFACLPTYETVGAFAPLLLVGARALLDFFVNGERTIASLHLFAYGHTSPPTLAGWYEGASVVGIGAASLAICFVTASPLASDIWRWAFGAGAFIGFLGFLARMSFPLSPHFKRATNPPRFLHRQLWQKRTSILCVACMNSFGHLTYAIPFVFMNSYVPQVTSVSLQQMTQVNTLFLGFDLLFLLGITRLMQYVKIEKALFSAASVFVLSFCVLFSCIEGSGFFYVTAIRLWLVFWGVLFTCAFRLWIIQHFQGPDAYLISGFGATIGSSTLGRNSPTFLLLCIHWTGYPSGASLYAILLGGLVLWAIRHKNQE